AQLLALAFLALARVALALAGQAGRDRHAAHHDEAADAEHRLGRLGRRGRAMALVEAAHDRAGVDVDREARRHDDLEAAHHARHVQLGHAGAEVGLAKIEAASAPEAFHVHLARHDPAALAID